MFVIIKNVKNKKGISIPVILLNSDHEVWEFDTYESAKK